MPNFMNLRIKTKINEGKMKKNYISFVILLLILSTANIFAQAASITWPLASSVTPDPAIGNIQGHDEIIGAGPSPTMSVFAYNGGQRLWVGTNGWVAGSLDATRYIQFDVNPTAGNSFNVNSVTFNYGDFPNGTDFNRINSQVFYSTDGWGTSTGLGSTLIYKNTTMQTFSVSNVNIAVASGHAAFNPVPGARFFGL